MNDYTVCIVIPNYNHGVGFQSVVTRLCAFNLPIIVVNDGSNSATSKILADIEEKYKLVEVLNLGENQGKGGAVMTGLLHAYQTGFSHAFQIDADGQHNLNDIESFLAKSALSPDALICGCPVYDDSVPIGRLLSRYITHFWVWVETLSFTIKDSMCGFRVYPLGATNSVVKNNRLGKRMDFDTEILVRLFWEDVEIISLPTKVIYPENGVSHFNLFHDNWLITKMHTKLFFGMIKRVPKLLRRRKQKSKVKHWGQLKERGTHLGLTSLFFLYRLLGRWIMLGILHPIIAYFVFSGGESRKASIDYQLQLAKFQGKGNVKIGWKNIHKHFYEFGVSALDKISCWTGDIGRSDVKIHGVDTFNGVLESKKGAVFIGSHLGNLELCRALGEQGGRFKINAIVFNKNALKFQKVLAKSNVNAELNLIHVEKMGIETAILLKQKVDDGEIVVIVGDRTSVSSVGRVQYVDFLGRAAPFAEGPFILAGLLDCPVYLIFCIKEQGIYNIYLEHFANSLKFPRKLRQSMLVERVQDYANRLAYYCLKSPYQWFNFYDFWEEDKLSRLEQDKK